MSPPTQDAIQVQAYFEPIVGEDLKALPPERLKLLLGCFSELEKERTYKTSDFEVFLPPETRSEFVGEIWDLEEGSANKFLDQFDDRTADTATKREANGRYAMIRASSDTHMEILLRFHGEIQVAEDFTLTPAQFEGRLLFNKEKQRVEHFTLKVPTDHARNLNFEDFGETVSLGMVFTPKLELSAGSADLLNRTWSQEISLSEARKSLAKAFYPIEELEWIPPDEALDEAKKTGRPIMAILIEGALTDQSC